MVGDPNSRYVENGKAPKTGAFLIEYGFYNFDQSLFCFSDNFHFS